ncbi:MAG: patatin-like phospholipase family protein [Actinobacteria bacterium]|nr:patatin-like phospholipase family protein [Actinomycetota bacterium]
MLGGGGYPAMAFHAGTLLALEVDFGWDPRDASVVVGTSAGSLVGALLRAGLSTDDLAAWSSDVAPLVEREHLRQPIDRSALAGLRSAAHRRRRFAPRSLLRSVTDFGLLDNAAAIAELAPLLDSWPSDTLLVTANTRWGQRVVFGGDRRPPIWHAVAASCAIPFVFRPVRVDGRQYVDGGMRSATNADLLLEAGVDVAIVISPMTGEALSGRHGSTRCSARRRAAPWHPRSLGSALLASRRWSSNPMLRRCEPRAGTCCGAVGCVLSRAARSCRRRRA